MIHRLIVPLAGMPRTGSTFLFNCLLDILDSSKFGTFMNLGYLDLYRIETVNRIQTNDWEHRYQHMFDQQSENYNKHVIFKTCNLTNLIFTNLQSIGNVKPIFTIRNIEEVVKSIIGLYANYQTENQQIVHDVEIFLQLSLRSLCDIHENVMIVTYNELMDRQLDEMRKILDYLDIDISDQTIRVICDKFSRENVSTYLNNLDTVENDPIRLWHRMHLTRKHEIQQQDVRTVLDYLKDDINRVADIAGIDLWNI